MLITANLDIMIEGTLNQDFDVITSADTLEGGVDVYISVSSCNSAGNFEFDN